MSRLSKARDALGREQSESIVILGCGRLGGSLAASLSEKGSIVTVIDRSKDSFRKLSPSFGGLSIVGNVTDVEVLAEAEINDKTTVICVTNNGNTNIMAAQMAKVLFSAKRVVARLYDPEKACVYEDQGVETICPASLLLEAIDSLMDSVQGEDSI